MTYLRSCFIINALQAMLNSLQFLFCALSAYPFQVKILSEFPGFVRQLNDVSGLVYINEQSQTNKQTI